MEPKTKEFNQLAATALNDEKIQRNLQGLYNGFHQARIVAADATPNWEELREQARAIKAHTIENLDYYLEMVEKNVTKAGGKVFFAKDAAAAQQYVVDLAHARGVKMVVKSKSMVSEEMGLNKRLIEEGIAYPERIGIYGGSYGGYATLAGVTFTPDLYACAVDYVGVSNILTWLDAIPPYWEMYREMLYEMVGHPEEDRELLVSASPFYHADQIRVPLLVAQGANDPRVPKAESDQLVEALRERGIDVPYMVKENEGHGFRNEENRFDFYRAMENFLAEHLGGRLAP